MSEIWTTGRTKQRDWDGAAYYRVGNAYRVPESKIIVEATIWEYAREVEAVCHLVEDCRNGRQSDPQQVQGFIDPVILKALAASSDFPSKAYLHRKFPVQFGRHLNPPNRRYGLKGWREKSIFDSLYAHGGYGWNVRQLSACCPNSFDMESDDHSQLSRNKLHWLVIARRGNIFSKIDPAELDWYVNLVDSDPERYINTALYADNEFLVISAAHVDLESRRICLSDPEVDLYESYEVWTIDWQTAIKYAKGKNLGTEFRKAYCRRNDPPYLWGRKPLEVALRALFAYRFARANLDKIPPTLRIGKRSNSLKYPLSPVRSCGRQVHKLANEARPMAHKVFPDLKNVELLSRMSTHVLPNSGNSLDFAWKAAFISDLDERGRLNRAKRKAQSVWTREGD